LLSVITLLSIPLNRYCSWIMEGRYHAARWLSEVTLTFDYDPSVPGVSS
jgi:hypothetical protein